MIRVHHLNASRSHRILWLLEELSLTYEIVPHQRERSGLAPRSLRAIHPLGKAPVVEEDGRLLAESGAIIQLLVERHDRGGALAPPRGTPEWERYLYWLHAAEGSAMPPLFLQLVLTRMGPLGWPAQGFARRAVKTYFDYVDAELGKQPWLAGKDFSAADIAMSFAIEAALVRGGHAGRHLHDFVTRIHARPAWQRAVQRGGPLEVLG